MHDNKGRPLKEGDLVLIPMVVQHAHPGTDYCNMTVRSVHGRKPDNYPEVLTGNTNVCFRANPEDINSVDDIADMFLGRSAVDGAQQELPLQE